MPYIKEAARAYIDNGNSPRSAGELTYIVYAAALHLLGRAPTFSDFAAVLGAIEAAKMEIYRRIIAPYEDMKVKENGDI